MQFIILPKFKPLSGTVKWIKRFAFLPVYTLVVTEGNRSSYPGPTKILVWLEFYHKLYIYAPHNECYLYDKPWVFYGKYSKQQKEKYNVKTKN